MDITFLAKLQPFLEKFSIPSEKIEEVLRNDVDLLEIVSDLFSCEYSDEARKWLLMPLKAYNSSFLESALDRVHLESNNILLDEFVRTMIEIKKDIFLGIDSSLSDVFSYDYFERISLMIADISRMKQFSSLYIAYFCSNKDALEYLATSFPCAEFVDSLGMSCQPYQFFCTHYESFLQLNAKLFRSFVSKNICHYHSDGVTFSFSDMESVVSENKTGSIIDCGDFSDLLDFILDNKNTKNERMSLLPLLTSFYVDNKYDRKDVYAFLGRFSFAPDSFFSFLSDHIDTYDYYIDNLLESEFRNSTDLFRFLSNLSDEEKRSAVYPLLISSQYDYFASDKKACLLANVENYNIESIESLGIELDDSSILFDDVSDLKCFDELLRFLASDTKKEFRNKMTAIHAVSHQLDAKCLDQYLWYLEKSNLHKGSEYKAHSAYFKKHSIDKFFSSFEMESWKKDILLMKTDDKDKKKQQLRLVKKCPISRLESAEFYKKVATTLEYSNDKDRIKDIVNLVINPLFYHLSNQKQGELLSDLAIKSSTTTVVTEKGSVDFIIPNAEYSFEQLPEEGFVKCKGRGVNGSIELLVGRSQK